MGGVNIVALWFLITFLLCSVVCFSSSLDGHPISWCVAREGANKVRLKSFMDSVCSNQDCSEIKRGGSCFEPNTLENHASYAIDLSYRLTGTCPSYVATITLQDPTFGKCHYP